MPLSKPGAQLLSLHPGPIRAMINSFGTSYGRWTKTVHRKPRTMNETCRSVAQQRFSMILLRYLPRDGLATWDLQRYVLYGAPRSPSWACAWRWAHRAMCKLGLVQDEVDCIGAGMDCCRRMV